VSEPPKKLPTAILWAVLLLVIGGVAAAYLGTRFSASARAAKLPVLAELPEFSLTDRSGRGVTRKDMLGKVSVVDFIFTNCAAQCPQVTAQMVKVQAFALPRWKNVQLMSLTVDPENDTLEALAKYARDFGADPERWLFLTGPREPLDDLTRNGFKAASASPVPVDTSPDAILHSVSLVLVDGRARVRGYYQSTDPEEMKKLRGDLAALASSGG
jgi:cytochrome oxidase Cu insertion factor (SCO1/SenC/PrrC family)